MIKMILKSFILLVFSSSSILASQLNNETVKIWQQGGLDKAIALVHDVSLQTSDDTSAVKEHNSIVSPKKRLGDLPNASLKAKDENKYIEAQSLLDKATLISNKHSHYAEVQNQLIAAKEKVHAEVLTQQKKLNTENALETVSSDNGTFVGGEIDPLGKTIQAISPNRPPFLPLPPLKLTPVLPMVELGSSQYAGMISTAKEATRTLMGEMSEADGQNFEKYWAKYYDYPSAEIIKYYRHATPLLSEFLNIRDAIATTSAAFDEAWSEAMLAGEYGSEDGADAALAQADMLKDYLVALKARGDALSQALQDLGEAPNPVVAKETAHSQHKSAIDTIKGLFTEAPTLEGIWYGAVEYDKDFWIKGIKGQPLLFLIYAVGDPAQSKYRALILDASEDDDKTDPYIGIFGMYDGDNPDIPGMLPYFDDSQLKHTYEIKDDEETMVITFSANRLEDGTTSFDYPPPVALDTVESAYGKVQRKLKDDRTELATATDNVQVDTNEELVKQSSTKVVSEVVLTMIERAALDELNDVRLHNKLTPIFVQTTQQWLSKRPFSQKTNLAQDRKTFSAMFAKNLGPQVKKGAKKISETLPEQSVDEPVQEDKKSEDEAERIAKLERINFHKQNMIIIKHNLERDRIDLEKEKDHERRANLEFRVVGALSDLQAEEDLIASIQTGEIVRNRTAFDDYAHAGFISNIRQSQQEIEHFERSCDALFKLSGMLPGREGIEARAFVERQLSPDIRLKMDQNAIVNISNALGKKVEGYYLGLEAKSDEDAAYANLGLEAAQNVKSAADSSMMVLSLFGGQYVGATYQAATGYIEGGPTEVVLRTASMFGPTAGAAAEAMRGYREGGLTEAAKRGVISFATSKGLEYGMGKVLSKSKQQPAQKSVSKAVDSPDVPVTVSKPSSLATQNKLSNLPKPIDSRTLEQFKKARKQGEDLVQDFRLSQQSLSDAGASGASPEAIMRLQVQVRNKVTAVNGNPHAKNFLKYKGDTGVQRSYNAHLRAIHADVEAKFHTNMQSKGWNQQPLKEFRNSASAGSVGMDFDIGLDEQMVKSLSQNGKPAKLQQWQEDAQKAWNEAYNSSTGHNAELAWETVTTSIHGESYKDMAWLGANKSEISKIWGQQASDVTRYKSWHMLNDPNLSQMEKLQEISRGAAKDMKTKLNPLLDRVKPTGKSLEKFQDARTHWNQVGQILSDFGENNIDPITADRRIRELTGGKSIPDVVEDMTYLLEGAIKFGKTL